MVNHRNRLNDSPPLNPNLKPESWFENVLSIPEPTSLSGGKRTVQINTEQLEGCLTPFL